MRNHMKTIPKRPQLALKRMNLELQSRARVAASVFLAREGVIPRASYVEIPTVCALIRDIADGKQRILPTSDPKKRLEAGRYLRGHVPGCLSLH